MTQLSTTEAVVNRPLSGNLRGACCSRDKAAPRPVNSCSDPCVHRGGGAAQAAALVAGEGGCLPPGWGATGPSRLPQGSWAVLGSLTTLERRGPATLTLRHPGPSRLPPRQRAPEPHPLQPQAPWS